LAYVSIGFNKSRHYYLHAFNRVYSFSPFSLEAPVQASKYRKNYGLDHITQSVVDGKSADILAWAESGEEIFVGEQ
jgi:hypothetical protein